MDPLIDEPFDVVARYSALVAGAVDFELVIADLERMLSSELTSNSEPTYAPGWFQSAAFRRLEKLHAAYNAVMDALLSAFVKSGEPPEAQIDARLRLRFFFERLAKERGARVLLATLNYDDFLDDVLEWTDGFVPLKDATYAVFDPKTWFAEVERQERNYSCICTAAFASAGSPKKS